MNTTTAKQIKLQHGIGRIYAYYNSGHSFMIHSDLPGMWTINYTTPEQAKETWTVATLKEARALIAATI